ncbi:hypothetical protein [Lacisediminihabitans changchengi]|uniref:Uncharacterized protein n=1 Tax=Lacisediminihabitans changchengi TaxID=2787634 RepID=A0A934SND5_9MICO|nr:hypothetical protein [Lacisediminihabitans changchengi]MBK4348504.1 hypothetical protein [Lacisediminihabitans changchengi]
MGTPKKLVTPRRLIAVGAVLAAVVLVVGIGFTALSSGMSTGQAGKSAHGSAGPSSSNSATDDSAAGADTETGADTEAGAADTTPSPRPTAPRTATEVEAGGSVSHTLPPSAPSAPLVSLPLPASASALKKLVTGFPVAVLVMPSATIVDSSVSSSGDILQATLSAKTTADSDDVITYYEKQFAKVGLVGSSTPASGGSLSYSFVRGSNSIALTVKPSKSGGSTFTLFGVLNASA